MGMKETTSAQDMYLQFLTYVKLPPLLADCMDNLPWLLPSLLPVFLLSPALPCTGGLLVWA